MLPRKAVDTSFLQVWKAIEWGSVQPDQVVGNSTYGGEVEI